MKKKILILMSLIFCMTLTACKENKGTSYTKEQQAVVGFLENLKKGKYESASQYVENPTDFMKLAELKFFDVTNIEQEYVDKRPVIDYQIEQEEIESEDKKGKVLFLTVVINNYSNAGKNYLYALNQDIDNTNIAKEIEKGFKEGKPLKVTKVPVELIQTEDGNYLIKLEEVKLAGIETTMTNYIFFNNVMFNRILSGYAGAIDEVLNEEMPDDEKPKKSEDGSYDIDYFDKLIEEKNKEDNTNQKIENTEVSNVEKSEDTATENPNEQKKEQIKKEGSNSNPPIEKTEEKKNQEQVAEEQMFEVEK